MTRDYNIQRSDDEDEEQEEDDDDDDLSPPPPPPAEQSCQRNKEAENKVFKRSKCGHCSPLKPFNPSGNIPTTVYKNIHPGSR